MKEGSTETHAERRKLQLHMLERVLKESCLKLLRESCLKHSVG